MTNSDVHNLLNELEAFEETAANVGMELRLSLADLVIEKLRARGWTQRRLAKEAGVKEPVVSRIIHADVNCTLETAANLLFALGISARFAEAPRADDAEANRRDRPIVGIRKSKRTQRPDR